MADDSIPSHSVSGDPGPRIWTEPRVRFWWIAAAILLAIAIGYAIDGFSDWRIEADLIHHGTLVQATITESGGGPPHRVIDENSAWDVKFELNGQTEVETDYPPDASVRHYNGDVVPLHVDPNNPDHWTNRTTPPPLSQRLIGLPFILGMMAICIIIAVVRIFRLRKICAEGIKGPAKILSLSQSALAPRSYRVRCAWADERSRTIYSVFVPRHLAPHLGDKISIAAAPKSALAVLFSNDIRRGVYSSSSLEESDS